VCHGSEILQAALEGAQVSEHEMHCRHEFPDERESGNWLTQPIGEMDPGISG